MLLLRLGTAGAGTQDARCGIGNANYYLLSRGILRIIVVGASWLDEGRIEDLAYLAAGGAVGRAEVAAGARFARAATVVAAEDTALHRPFDEDKEGLGGGHVVER